MDGKRLMRLLMVGAGAIAAVAAMLALLVTLNSGWSFADCTGTGKLGWTLPLLTGLLVGGVAWMLLFKAPNYADDHDPPHSVPCPSCEKAVMEDWRMCPFCGRSFAHEQAAG